MKKTNKLGLCVAGAFILTFAVWTFLVRFVDLAPIGPMGSYVGFAKINAAAHAFTGVHMSLYTITDWLGLVPIATALGFAVLGLFQWIKRGSVTKVDKSILILGGFYLTMVAVYLIFEMAVINYRPVLIDGRLEASYPSSTTTLVMCVMPTAAMQLYGRIKIRAFRVAVMLTIISFTLFMVIGRFISGVHWITDIIGGALISAGLVTAYYSINDLIAKG